MGRNRRILTLLKVKRSRVEETVLSEHIMNEYLNNRKEKEKDQDEKSLICLASIEICLLQYLKLKDHKQIQIHIYNTDTLIRLQSKHEYKNIFCILIFYLRIIRLVKRNRKRETEREMKVDLARRREVKCANCCNLKKLKIVRTCSICEFAKNAIPDFR